MNIVCDYERGVVWQYQDENSEDGAWEVEVALFFLLSPCPPKYLCTALSLPYPGGELILK
uniref:Uncharacterized protein n=1 Tax=Anguilla anguilla TaxID=7936 RepID=A0A0E9WIT7_ANGAN